jgi:hypothetical protein
MATGETPPDMRRSFLSKLALAIVTGAVLVYLGIVWNDARQGEQKRAAHAAIAARPAASAASASRPTPAPASAAIAPTTEAVKKCVQGDRTTYSDADCPPGAAATPLAINPRQNLADGLPRAQIDPPARTSSAPRAAANEADLRVLRCEALAARIGHIDTEARQAMPQARQDDLAAERKKARAEQTRLRC